MSPNPYISVIIPSYNSFRTIETTIQGIISQRGVEDLCEVIVVDSSDDTCTKVILSHLNHPLVKVINSGEKVIPSHQRNIGAYNSQGKLLVFIDSDAYPASNWLCSIKKAYSNGYMVGGGSVLIQDEQRIIKHIVAQYYFEFGEFIPTGEIRSKKMIPSCNLFCDKVLFFKVNGFPEIRASEDSLFCVNVNKCCTLFFFPEIQIFHIFRDEKKCALRNQKLLGKYIIIYRKCLNPCIYNKKVILTCLLPLIVLYKFVVVYFRFVPKSFKHFIMINKAFFQFVNCLIYWSIGVFQGVFSNVQYRNDHVNSKTSESQFS